MVTSKSLRSLPTVVAIGVTGVATGLFEEILLVLVVVEVVVVVVVLGVVKKLLLLLLLMFRLELLLLMAKLSKHILACLTLMGMLSSSRASIDEDQRP